MSTIGMATDKIVCTVEGNSKKSTILITASLITMEASKITIEGDTSC